MRQPHPHKPEEKAAFAKEQRQSEAAAQVRKVDDLLKWMETSQGRRQAFDLLRQGLRLPGQTVSNTNGSLQSYQLGRSDALRGLDELMRRHCNDLWLKMLDENEDQENEQ